MSTPQEDKDLAISLALEAVLKLGRPEFTVYATLDLDKPESIENFSKFGELLLDAYRKGEQNNRDKLSPLYKLWRRLWDSKKPPREWDEIDDLWNEHMRF